MAARAGAEVAIVGGGITGLVLLHYLRKRGADAVLLEASPRPGGVMATEVEGGLPLELGPQRARLDPNLQSLVDDLGLGGELVRGPAHLQLMVYRDGRMGRAPLSFRDALGTDLLSVRGKLRALLEPFRAGPRGDETVGAYFRRAFGDEAYRALLAPLYGGLYASDPDEMVVRLSLGRLLEEQGLAGRSLLLALLKGARKRSAAPPPVSFRSGLGTLPRALARAHEDRVRMATPVEALEADPAASRRWRLRTAHGEELSARSVVITTPAPDAARLLEGIQTEAARALGELRYNPLAVVHLLARESLPWAGFQVARGEATPLRGVTSHGALFGREGLHTAFLGGMGAEEVVEGSDDRVGREAREAFARATGLEAEVLGVHRTWIPAWDRTWAALDRLQENPPPEGVLLAGSWRTRPGLPGRWREARALADALAPHPEPGAEKAPEGVRDGDEDHGAQG